MTKRKYTHSCKRCLKVWTAKRYWYGECPFCKNDFTKSGHHRLRNQIYGEDRHPYAVKEKPKMKE